VKLAARVKPAYGPMLPDLVARRLGGLPRAARPVGLVFGVCVVALTLILTLRGGSAAISATAGSVRFSFDYTGLAREPAPAGDVVALAAHRGSRLVAQILVAPLRLPPFSGDATGVEPVVAAGAMRLLAARTPGVTLENTGPTIVNGLAGYNFTYTQRRGGATYFGRVIFLTPSSRSRAGLIVSLLAEPVSAGIIAPGGSSLAGALYEPGQGGVGVLFQPSGLLSRPLATLRIAG
jgi:hypothetical protein